MELKLWVDGDCKSCKKVLEELALFERTQRPDVYGNRVIDTGRKVSGFTLVPDFNSSGMLTHWHLEREK